MGMKPSADGSVDMRDLYGFTDDRLYADDHPENVAMRGKPRAEWPAAFEITWDYTPQHFHHALDGVSASEFWEDGDVVLIGEADLAEIDANLFGISKKSKSELWKTRPDKVARSILCWSHGHLITPPMLAISMGVLVINGGNHRMAVCRAADLTRLPFLFIAQHQEELAAMLPSFSVIPTETPPPQGSNLE